MLRASVAVVLCVALASVVRAQCPDEDPDLVPWDPPANESQDFVIDGQKLLFTGTSLNLRTITIQNGGRLVVRDDGTARQIRFRHMLIQSNGEFWVGSETCPFQSRLNIVLYGRSDATDIGEVPIFGRKFIGVAPTGSIVIYGVSKLSWTFLETTISPGTADRIVTLENAPTNWAVGDRVVVASSDYDMNHAEEFTVGECGSCNANQVNLQGVAVYAHSGTVSAHGVDTRAEIGILTHNIKIYGEMEPACYGSNFCQFFDYDTYGGHIQMLAGFRKADFHGIELFHMGQQQLGKYPIHYHVVGAVYGSFTRGVSIHNCFSRCVTLHASEGLTVQDVVGYNTLGHCYFLEDGNEQNNVLIHNLGLVTKPGTLLPSDRDKNMCETMLNGVYPGYVPNAEKECMGASTFWITHPNNTFVNNAAAGSISNGFHFVFHRVPTGPSAGTLPEFHGERTTITQFSGNRAHSNVDNGLLIDRGVKVTPASQEDPREFLALVDSARFMPHVNRNPLGPRDPAIITNFVAYKNSRGAVVRGGDVWIQNSKFTDNDVAFTANSDDQLPYDAGSHQEIIGSVIVATDDTNNAEWQARSYPSVGVQLRGGPVVVDQNNFYGYTSTGGREAYAVGFYPQNPGQLGSSTFIGSNTGDETALRVYFGRRDLNSIYGPYNADGDNFQIFYDSNGSLTGVPEAYAVRLDNPLLRGDTCTTLTPSNAAACVGNDYGQIFINAQTKTANLTIRSASAPSNMATLQGVNKDNSADFPDTTQYQATLVAERDYFVIFGLPTTPSWIELWNHNFPQFGHAVVGIDYPGSAPTFNLQYIEWQQMSNQISRQLPMTAGASLDDVKNDVDGLTYFWDGSSLLWVKLLNRYEKDGYNYCAAQGCQIVRITSTFP